MKITDINFRTNGKRARSSAKIEWEDCERSPQEIFFETEPEFSHSIHPDPHSFVIASIFPALYFGESRLYIDEAICPKLKDGLITAMQLLHHWWYPPEHQIVTIEAKKIKTVSQDDQPKRAAFCFSGGVDSLATLYQNHLEYPKEHPGYLKDGLLVFGLEVQDIDQFQKVLRLIASIADASELTFIPVYSNIIELGPKDLRELWHKFWLYQYMSAAFAAIAHAFSKRWHSFSVNSSHDIPNLIPHGSNPLLTSNYSSWGLQLKEEGINLSRVKKVQLIANWDVALQNLRVCNNDDQYQEGILNCGKCEKCVRTMLALEAAGALKRSTAFPVRTITPEMVDAAVRLAENTLPLHKELLGPLNESGRHDLARAVERKIVEFYKNQRNEKWKRPILEIDQKYFNGNLKRIKNHLIDGSKS